MNTRVSTVGIILAAGASTRMGKAKQLLMLEGQPLVTRMCFLAQAAGFDAVVVVTGARQKAIVNALPDFVGTVYNPDWASGMGSSVATGLSYALQRFSPIEMAGFILTDQPFLSVEFLSALLRQMQHTEAPGVAAEYDGTLGVPAVFRSQLFPDLLKLRGEKGAKPILVKYQQVLQSLPFPQGGFDLDYPEDWQRFLAQ